MLNIVKTKRTLQRWPSWILTIVVSLAILYLTLMPQPLPDDTPKLFPGADKVVHALMFGGLTFVILLDTQRRRNYSSSGRKSSGSDRKPIGEEQAKAGEQATFWQPLSKRYVWTVAAISALAGIIIECLQWAMGLGRGFEVADIVADTVGSFVFAALWLVFQHHWTD